MARVKEFTYKEDMLRVFEKICLKPEAEGANKRAD